MKNRLIYIVLCFLFVFGGAKNNHAAELVGGIGAIVIVQGKNGNCGILVNPPLEYIDANGRLSLPLNIEIREAGTGQIVFSATTFENLIYLPNIKTRDHLVIITIGSFSYQELMRL